MPAGTLVSHPIESSRRLPIVRAFPNVHRVFSSRSLALEAREANLEPASIALNTKTLAFVQSLVQQTVAPSAPSHTSEKIAAGTPRASLPVDNFLSDDRTEAKEASKLDPSKQSSEESDQLSKDDRRWWFRMIGRIIEGVD